MRSRNIENLRDEFYNKHPELKDTIEILEVDTTIATSKSARIIVKLHCKKHDEVFYAFSEDIIKPNFYGCSQCAIDINKESRNTERKMALGNLKNTVSKNYPEYELIEDSYIMLYKPIFLKCKKHNIIFLTFPIKLKLSQVNITNVIRCPKCTIEYYTDSEENKTRLQEFMNKVHERFSHFSEIPGKTVYINNGTNIWLHCDIHNIDFQVRPGNLLSHNDRCGCPKCGLEQKLETVRKREEDRLIKDINDYDKNIDTSKLVYKDSTTKVMLYCKICKEFFWKTPNDIRFSMREEKPICPSCSHYLLRQDRKQEVQDTIEKRYPGEFDLSNMVFIKNSIPITGIRCIRCNKEFSIYYGNFIIGCGCPVCSQSCGESYVEDWLKDKNIEYVHLFNIDKSIIPGKKEEWGVEIDFTLGYNGRTIWIECNGEQHYTWCKHFQNTVEDFENQLRRDNNVREYCKANNILLIEIPWTYYRKDKIYEILDKAIIENMPLPELIKAPEIQYNRTKAERGEK